jgi:hypothetical protein
VLVFAVVVLGFACYCQLLAVVDCATLSFLFSFSHLLFVHRDSAEKTRIPRALYMDYAKRPVSKVNVQDLPRPTKRLQRGRLKKKMELVAKSGNKTMNRSQRITVCKAAPH